MRNFEGISKTDEGISSVSKETNGIFATKCSRVDQVKFMEDSL